MARPGRIRLPASLDRADVPRIVRRAVVASREASVVSCDAGRVTPAGLAAVDVLAQIALAVRRDRRSFRIEAMSRELRELLELCGLADCLGPEDHENAVAPSRRGGAGARTAGRTARCRGRT